MKTNHHLMTLAIAAGLAGLTFTAAAAQEAELIEVVVPGESDAELRINLSGKLRMLSQRVAAAACLQTQGTNTELSATMLSGAVAEFDSILNALEFGDQSMGIAHPEEAARTLASIANVTSAWQPMRDAATALIADNTNDAALAVILNQDGPLLEETLGFAVVVASNYSIYLDVVEADAFLIEIAGRQRMLLQQMSKNACIVAAELDDDHAFDELTTAVGTFEATLIALRDGMPAAGIRRPPNQMIGDQLTSVFGRWSAIRPVLDAVMVGEDVAPEVLATLAHDLEVALVEMNTAVTLYTAATTQTSKQGEEE